MKITAVSLAISGALIAASYADAQAYTSLGSFTSKNAAFTAISEGDLIISGFGVFQSDTISKVSGVGAQLPKLSTVSPAVITTAVTWPNEVVYAPANAIPGHPKVLVSAGGFLTPGKGNGAITLIEESSRTVKKITTSSNLFYHQVEWLDVDGDGLLDIVTAGANKPLFGGGKGSLFWLKQPAQNPLSSTWTATKVIDGPDVFFRITDLNGDGIKELLAPQFFSNKLAVYTNLNWLKPAEGFKQIIVDSAIGPVFKAEDVDLNGDGKKELLVTNHVSDKTAGLFVYDIPSTLTGTWTKRTIASGFVTKNSGPGQASPGAAVVVYPTSTSKTPSILLAGDGNQAAYLYTPNGANFNYTQTVVLDSGATIGAITAGDVTGDGKAEFFIPVYEKGTVYGYSFN